MSHEPLDRHKSIDPRAPHGYAYPVWSLAVAAIGPAWGVSGCDLSADACSRACRPTDRTATSATFKISDARPSRRVTCSKPPGLLVTCEVFGVSWQASSDHRA